MAPHFLPIVPYRPFSTFSRFGFAVRFTAVDSSAIPIPLPVNLKKEDEREVLSGHGRPRRNRPHRLRRRTARTRRSLFCHQLTDSRNLECGLFDNVGKLVKRAVTCAANGTRHNAGARNADIDNTVRLAYTVECACHKVQQALHSLSHRGRLSALPRGVPCCPSALRHPY